jgi:hypothetical protein
VIYIPLKILLYLDETWTYSKN